MKKDRLNTDRPFKPPAGTVKRRTASNNPGHIWRTKRIFKREHKLRLQNIPRTKAIFQRRKEAPGWNLKRLVQEWVVMIYANESHNNSCYLLIHNLDLVAKLKTMMKKYSRVLFTCVLGQGSRSQLSNPAQTGDYFSLTKSQPRKRLKQLETKEFQNRYHLVIELPRSLKAATNLTIH